MRDKIEMEQLNTMLQDLRQNRSASSTFRSIVQACFPPDTEFYFCLEHVSYAGRQDQPLRYPQGEQGNRHDLKNGKSRM